MDNFYILNEHFVVLSHDTHVTYIFFPLIIINYILTQKGKKKEKICHNL